MFESKFEKLWSIGIKTIVLGVVSIFIALLFVFSSLIANNNIIILKCAFIPMGSWIIYMIVQVVRMLKIYDKKENNV